MDSDEAEISNDTSVVGKDDSDDTEVSQMYQEHHGISWYVDSIPWCV